MTAFGGKAVIREGLAESRHWLSTNMRARAYEWPKADNSPGKMARMRYLNIAGALAGGGMAGGGNVTRAYRFVKIADRFCIAAGVDGALHRLFCRMQRGEQSSGLLTGSFRLLLSASGQRNQRDQSGTESVAVFEHFRDWLTLRKLRHARKMFPRSPVAATKAITSGRLLKREQADQRSPERFCCTQPIRVRARNGFEPKRRSNTIA